MSKILTICNVCIGRKQIKWSNGDIFWCSKCRGVGHLEVQLDPGEGIDEVEDEDVTIKQLTIKQYRCHSTFQCGEQIVGDWFEDREEAVKQAISWRGLPVGASYNYFIEEKVV